MRISLILFIGGMNYTILTTALVLNQILDDIVENELYLGFRKYFNTTYKDCVWRNAIKDHKLCTDEVKIWLFSNGSEELIDVSNSKWLESSMHWRSEKENILFLHGYAGGDMAAPTLLMRDAFIQNGQYNFFMVDYGPVSRAPCYVSLVQNIQYVSKCVASYLKDFFDSGMPKKSITCIGHSMGAHGCGGLKRYLGFRINKIIGLDAALPLISDSNRLSWRDARLVQTIQTNAGFYGDLGSIGHLDVCVNNGNIQPFCIKSANPNLCSHLYALCFIAQSLFDHDHQMEAKRCTQVCPHLSVFQIAALGVNENAIDNDMESILIGMNIPNRARGSYCLSSFERPFCATNTSKFGSKRCCSLTDMFS